MLCPLSLRGQGVNFITYLRLAPSLETYGATPPLSIITIAGKRIIYLTLYNFQHLNQTMTRIHYLCKSADILHFYSQHVSKKKHGITLT